MVYKHQNTWKKDQSSTFPLTMLTRTFSEIRVVQTWSSEPNPWNVRPPRHWGPGSTGARHRGRPQGWPAGPRVTTGRSAPLGPRPRGGAPPARPPPQLVCRGGHRGPNRPRRSGRALRAPGRRRAAGAPGAQGARSGAGRGRGTLCLNHTVTAGQGAAGAGPAR